MKKLWWIKWNYRWDCAELGKKSMFNGLLVGPDKFTE